jgi:hypothetical protein
MLIDTSYFVGELNIPNTDSPAVVEKLTWFINKYEVDILRDILGVDLYRAFMNALGQGEAVNTGYATGGNRPDLWITADVTPGFASGQNVYYDPTLADWQYTVTLSGYGPLQPGVDIAMDSNGFHWLYEHMIQSGERYMIKFTPKPITVVNPSVVSTYANVVNGLIDPTKGVDDKWKWLLNGLEYTDLDARKHKWQGIIAVADDTAPPKSLLANGIYCYLMRNNATFTLGTGEKVAKSDSSIGVSNTAKVSNAWNEMTVWIHEMIWFLDTFTSGPNRIYNNEWWLQNRYYLLKKYKKMNQFNL